MTASGGQHGITARLRKGFEVDGNDVGMTMTMSGYVVAHGDYHWQLAQPVGAKSGVEDPSIGMAVSRPRVVRLKALGPSWSGCSEQRCMGCSRRQEAAREREIRGSPVAGGNASRSFAIRSAFSSALLAIRPLAMRTGRVAEVLLGDRPARLRDRSESTRREVRMPDIVDRCVAVAGGGGH